MGIMRVVNPSPIAGWTIPDELRALPPRGVKLVGGLGSGCTLAGVRLFLMPHVLIGVSLASIAIFEPVLLLLARTTPAVVIDVYTSVGNKGGKSYHAKFEYASADSAAAARKIDDEQVTQREYQLLHPGDRLSLRAIELGPFHYAALSRSGFGYVRHRWGLWLVAVFWNAIVSVFVFVLWVIPIRRRLLVKNGTRLRGGSRIAAVSMGTRTSS